jgi:hypothetical protein
MRLGSVSPEVLRLEAQAITLPICAFPLADQRPVQHVARVELHRQLVGDELQHAARLSSRRSRSE